jgi:ketosteroid isomerase-like protein
MIFFIWTLDAPQEPGAQQIREAMKRQQEAWNRGDLQGFMADYWKSDSLKFIGKNGVTYGWQSTLDRYKQSYPDQATMGTLNFEIISLDMLDNTHYFMIGRWQLISKTKAPLSGHFTLLWKKIDHQWKIIVDHSS